MANPDWTRDELILALELYFREPSARGNKTHPGCVELSQTLNALPIHKGKSHETTFRNHNGVGMKLSNFLKYDPLYKGKGLQSGSRLEEEVWNSFASNHEKLSEVASAIKAGIAEIKNPDGTIQEFDDSDDEAEEGNLLIVLHKRRERDSSFARKKKNHTLQSFGHLACEVCGFDFRSVFGDHGHGFAECHHDRPISKMAPGEKTKMSDLRIVCANCHRMLHRGKPWPTITELRLMIQQRQA